MSFGDDTLDPVNKEVPPYHWRNRERFILPATVRAFKLIDDERVRQDAKWGEAEGRGLHRYTWLTILMEEVGELAKAFLTDNRPIDHTPERRLKEAIQVAAVATAIVEVLTAGNPEIEWQPEDGVGYQ
jgi:NTP pyrophosphatase (non-canonical NTP hydrolase)